MTQSKDVQGIELMIGDKIAFFEIPARKRDGKPFMSIGTIKNISKETGRLTIVRLDKVLRYRLPNVIALVPDENPEEGSGSGKEEPKEGSGQQEDPKGQPSSTQPEEEDGPNPFDKKDMEAKRKLAREKAQSDARIQKMFDDLDALEEAKRLQELSPEDIPSEPSGSGRSHYGVEYDMKTGETRKTACQCPRCVFGL